MGSQRDELVDEALRRWFCLRGLVVLDDIADRQRRTGERLEDAAAMELALEEVRTARGPT